ncbi:hypothetical protein CVT25_011750 [Psilocybe cyanescens]|uniref:Fungal-type protein kinase domain-containing protein n=1 Tax=Psilocybe cyanescens TaxID=93625 RepID=A0A409WIJ1_PSICY|nr:hypothetical protein CVT25_011750 [Psilocybe cyanescens]
MSSTIPPSDIPQAPKGSDATPRTPRTNAEKSTIPNVRPQIVHEMDREFVVCDLDAFMKRYLPFAPDDESVLDCVTNNLKPNSIMTGVDRSLRFTDYSTPPGSQMTEMKTYEDLERIGASIGQYSYPNHNRNQFHYRHTPDNHIYSKISGSSHKVDACFTSDPLIPGTNKIRMNTTSMAVPMEHKLSVNQRFDNNTKVVSANVHIMNEDVRRMFTFGITIECDQMSLWYHSRSHSAVSKPFSFVYKPLLLVKVFMSILFATTAQLGYDPLVTLEQDFKYTFNIPQGPGKPSRFFRTIKPIVEYRSNNITGRMTRIFHVYEVDSDPRREFVLKDVWIDKDAETEGQIQGALFGDIEKFWGETRPSNDELGELRSMHADLVASKKYKDFFLTMETDHVGDPSCVIADGAVPIRGLFDAPITIPVASVPSAQAPPSPTHGKRSTVGTPRPIPPTNTKAGSQSTNNLNQPRPPRGYTPRKHYRVVFQERCTSVGDLRVLGEVVDVLQQVLIPLQLMLCAGWVHRDISSGNILAFKKDPKSWQVKLSDLEYAKPFPPPAGYKASTDPKTLQGTPYFMPFEILQKRYLYLFSEDDISSSAWNSGDGFLSEKDDVVIHNFQHDLESVWWILLWTLTCRIVHAPCNTWALPIFQNITNLSPARAECFTLALQAGIPAEGDFQSKLAEPTREFGRCMELGRRFMFLEYRKRVKSRLLRERGSYAFIHQQFIKLFEQVALIKAEWRPVELIKSNPYSVPHITDPSKAPATDASTNQTSAEEAPAPQDVAASATTTRHIAQPARMRLKRERSEDEVERILRPERQLGKRSKGGLPK